MPLIARFSLDQARDAGPVYLYGSGEVGRSVFQILTHQGLDVAGFIDSFAGGGTCCGKPVYRLDEYLGRRTDRDRIVITSQSEWAIAMTLQEQGVDGFSSAYHLFRSKTRAESLGPRLRTLLAEFLEIAPPFPDSPVTPQAAVDQVMAWMEEAGPLSADANFGEISMVAPEVQAITQFLACVTRGAILEVGAYLGGLTVPVSIAARQRDARFVSVEAGGSHLSHPTLPTKDIVRDLKAHLDHFGVSDAVELIVGRTHEPEVEAAVAERLSGQPIGLLIDDSDGNVVDRFTRFGHLLAPNAFVVVDDFVDTYTPLPINKSIRTRRFLYQQIVAGDLVEIGVFGHGTWIGYRPGGLPH